MVILLVGDRRQETGVLGIPYEEGEFRIQTPGPLKITETTEE